MLKKLVQSRNFSRIYQQNKLKVPIGASQIQSEAKLKKDKTLKH